VQSADSLALHPPPDEIKVPDPITAPLLEDNAKRPPRKAPPHFRTAILVAVSLLVIIPGSYIIIKNQLPSPQGSIDDYTDIGLRIGKNDTGDWFVTIMTGRKSISGISIMIVDPHTGNVTVDKPLAVLTQTDLDATFSDNNHDGKLDAGDTLLLKASGGHIQAGQMFQLMMGQNRLVGRELPS